MNILTSKERAELRGKANMLDTTLMVGKGGVTDAVIAEAECQLTANELVKGKVLETALMDPREVSDAICAATGAEGVQVVGTKFVLWRKSDKKEEKAPAKPKPKKVNPVKAGIRARKQAMKKKREARNEYFHNAAVKAAIEKRRSSEENV